MVVVVWRSNNQDGSGSGIYGQRFDANGSNAGSEFLVNTATSSDQISPEITALSGGGFVVVWSSWWGDNDYNSVQGQVFDDAGLPVGSEFRVNTETQNNQHQSQIASLSNGGFVVVWTSDGQDGSGSGIYGQRFDSTGSAVGSEFLINTTIENDQSYAQVIGLTGGGFIAVWRSYNQDGSDWGVFGQRFDADGAAVGDEFQVNTMTQRSQDLAQ